MCWPQQRHIQIQEGLTNPVVQLGLPDYFIDHGDVQALLAMNGLDAQGIEKSIRKRLEKKTGQ